MNWTKVKDKLPKTKKNEEMTAEIGEIAFESDEIIAFNGEKHICKYTYWVDEFGEILEGGFFSNSENEYLSGVTRWADMGEG